MDEKKNKSIAVYRLDDEALENVSGGELDVPKTLISRAQQDQTVIVVTNGVRRHRKDK